MNENQFYLSEISSTLEDMTEAIWTLAKTSLFISLAVNKISDEDFKRIVDDLWDCFDIEKYPEKFDGLWDGINEQQNAKKLEFQKIIRERREQRKDEKITNTIQH